MGLSTLIDSNTKMLSKKVMDLEYKYNGMLSKVDIERRLRAYTKTKTEDVSLLSEKQYLMLAGYIKALEWVLSGEKKDTSLQKANLYTVEHKV